MNKTTKIMILRFALPLMLTNILISKLFKPQYLLYSIIFACLPMILNMKVCFYISNTLNILFLLTGKLFLLYISFGLIYATVYTYTTRLIITEQENIFNYVLKLDSLSILVSVILNINKLGQVLICIFLFQYINIFYYATIPIDNLNEENEYLLRTLKKAKPFISTNILCEYKRILEIKNTKHKSNYKYIIQQTFLLFIPFTNNLYLKVFICLGVFIPLPKSIIGNLIVLISVIFNTPLLGFFGAIFSKYSFPETWNPKLLIRFVVLKLFILWGFTNIFC